MKKFEERPLREPNLCASSTARRQKAFGCRATHLRLIRYIYFGTYATRPGHMTVDTGSRVDRSTSI